MSKPQDFSPEAHATLLAELMQLLNVSLDAQTLQRMAAYVALVVTWNKRLDLTAAKGARAQLEVLLADALVLARTELIPNLSRCLDVGSGAGAPALPLLLARADLNATLLEPLRKRVAFLRTAVGTLQLVQRSVIIEAKLDLAAPEAPGAAVDVALSRATFAPEVWLSAALQLAPRALVLLAGQAEPAAPAGSALVHTHAYELPWSRAARRIAVYERRS